MILRSGLTIGALGSIAGLIGALWLTRFVSGMLYRVKPRDIGTLVEVVVVMVGLTALSALMPALKVSRLDPSRTLREE